MYWNWQLRYHFGIDPTTLSIDEWASACAHLEHIRNAEKEAGTQ